MMLPTRLDLVDEGVGTGTVLRRMTDDAYAVVVERTLVYPIICMMKPKIWKKVRENSFNNEDEIGWVDSSKSFLVRQIDPTEEKDWLVMTEGSEFSLTGE